MVVQIVSGSLPSWSRVVLPALVEADTGKVTGMGALQLFPLADKVAPVIDFLSSDKVHERRGWH